MRGPFGASLLRVQRPDAGGASERVCSQMGGDTRSYVSLFHLCASFEVSELSRLLQRIAHFAHHDDEDSKWFASVTDLGW